MFGDLAEFDRSALTESTGHDNPPCEQLRSFGCDGVEPRRQHVELEVLLWKRKVALAGSVEKDASSWAS